jgi:hypothetical protein
MNHSLTTADRGTHIRMLLVSLAGVLAFIVTFAGVQATQDTGPMARLDGPAIVKTGPPAVMTSRDAGRAIR